MWTLHIYPRDADGLGCCYFFYFHFFNLRASALEQNHLGELFKLPGPLSGTISGPRIN